MPVQSVEMKSKPAASPRMKVDWPIALGKVGVWLTVISFGGIVWAVNGGFSVIGLGVIARAFNDAGRLFWAAATALQFPVPVEVPGLPTTQPVIPWCAVVASSLLQVVVLYLKLSGRGIPIWLLATAVALSLYDYSTTYFGLGEVVWLAQTGWIVRGVIAFILTFSFEAAISFMLRRR